ncbi:hypothetical protein NKH72_12230 [Mesorhizobium sp. M0955]
MEELSEELAPVFVNGIGQASIAPDTLVRCGGKNVCHRPRALIHQTYLADDETSSAFGASFVVCDHAIADEAPVRQAGLVSG